MPRSPAIVWLVHSISLFRLLGALLFASLAFQDVPVEILACIYGMAMGSDVADGLLARILKTESYAGRILDLVSDKSLTIVSLLYAAERSIALPPLALIATREIIVLGLRAVVVEGNQLLPTNRLFGGLMAVALWGNTLVLVCADNGSALHGAAGLAYWICAVVFAVNLASRLYASRRRIRDSLMNAE